MAAVAVACTSVGEMHSRCRIVALDSIRLGKALLLILWQNGYGKLIMADRTTLEALRPAKAAKRSQKDFREQRGAGAYF